MTNNDSSRVKTDDPFLLQYQSSELGIASEFLTNWLPFLCRDLCHNCSRTLSDRIRSLDELDGSETEGVNLDDNRASSSANNNDSEIMNDDCDTHSLGSWKDVTETGSWKDGPDVASEHERDASGGGEFAVETPSQRISWADMAQEDELEEEEEEHESNKQMYDTNCSPGELRASNVVEKPKLSREHREKLRFLNVRRKKDFICLEKIKGKLVNSENNKGKIVNILEGLELHAGVFSAAEQKRIVDFIYKLQEMGSKGELKERTYSAPRKWMKGKGRVTIQFGCCYNYATDKNGNPPGILQSEMVDPIPDLFKVIIRRLIRWRVLPPTCVPDSCIVNIYEEGDCIPPHIDNHDFVRPFCTVSFLSECNIVFGSNLKVVGPGEFAGSIGIPLPVGSVLVLNGNAADVAKHCVPAVPTKRISITFRRMDESKRPTGFVPEADLQGIEPLSYDGNKSKMLTSDDRAWKQRFRREAKPGAREDAERSDARSQLRNSSRFQRGPANKPRVRGNIGS